jgi:hypothetical protein
VVVVTVHTLFGSMNLKGNLYFTVLFYYFCRYGNTINKKMFSNKFSYQFLSFVAILRWVSFNLIVCMHKLLIKLNFAFSLVFQTLLIGG